jgi:signal transduction histidine kinase
MVTSIPQIEGIAIPVLGLCIIFALAIAAFLEPKKDYSRRVYIFMLIFCAIVLLTECFQWYWDNIEQNVRGGIPMWIVMFVFYSMLAAICYCWTIYAYYWFNGRSVSGRPAALLLTAPVCEVIALGSNFFTGSIYFVSAEGIYSRGNGFVIYIAFSFLYLILAIIVTALAALKHSGTKRRRDFVMFVLCFLFPVVGPFVQYAFPMLSLMGVTEAIALLIVYTSIQQKTTAMHAAEMARYKLEYGQYEKTLEQLLSAGAKAIYVLRLNVTRNACGEQSLDELCEKLMSEIRDRQEKDSFREFLARDVLLEKFEKQERQLSVDYHRTAENGEPRLIRAHLNMLKNPGSGDIEAIVYSEDIDRQEKEDRIISAIAQRQYDNIALMDAATVKFTYKHAGTLYNEFGNVIMAEHDVVMGKYIDRISDIDEPGSEREKLSAATVMAALRRSGEYIYIFNMREKDGRIRQKRISYQFLDDKKTEVLMLVSDITEERKVERERADTLQNALMKARHADAMKTDFLSNLSHDMRTPLNAVLGYANLAKTAGDPAVTDDYIDKIERAGNIMLELVNDTLDLSKIESGEIMLKPVATTCDDIVHKVVSSIIPQIREKQIEFKLDDSRASAVPIKADPLRLHEILINLLSNAIKFTPAKGCVTMIIENAGMDDDMVRDVITVRDTGCGMKPEFIPKMFEPFSQERQNEDTQGSGLGLSIVRRLVDMMGGTIEVNSVIGKGTEFIIHMSFERAEEDVSEPVAGSDEDIRLEGRCVLLVEDNTMNTEIARVLLESKGIRVMTAENGLAACKIFADSKPGDFDAILMDIRMPVMNGREATIKLRGMERPDASVIPIIAMSADAFDDDIQASLAAGMDMHIAKPIIPEQLFACLQKVMK